MSYFLRPHDCVALISPAKYVTPSVLANARLWLESWGYQVWVGPHALGQCGAFSGSDEERLADLQTALDDPHIRAIFCSRGGYGSLRLLDKINWEAFSRHPKWIIGYSDITALQCEAIKHASQALHAEMPLRFPFFPEENDDLLALQEILRGESRPMKLAPHPLNVFGSCSAPLVGGNLAVLCSLLGSSSELDTDAKILFVEEVGEYLYAFDRLWQCWRRAGKLRGVKAVVCGHFSDFCDNEPAFGRSAEEIVSDACRSEGIPLLFGLPAGHVSPNQPLLLGETYSLRVDAQGGTLALRA